MNASEVPKPEHVEHSPRPPLKRVSVLVYTETVFGREVHAGIQDYRHEISRQQNWHLIERLLVEVKPEQRVRIDRPDGIIAQVFDVDLARRIDEVGIPWVNIGDRIPELEVPLITTNDHEVGRAAAEYLAQSGVRQFGFVSNGWAYAKLRYEAFSAYMQGLGLVCEYIEAEPIASWNATPEQMEHANERVSGWLVSQPKPLGVFCCNDYFARAVNDLCARAGLDVPQQVMILGVDNDDLMCGSMQPSMSSIQLNAEHIGYRAAATLDRLMKGENSLPMVDAVDPIGIVPRMSTELVAIDDEIVRNALLFIQENACAPINVDDVAKRVGISRRLLELRFNKALNKSPAHEIRRQRLERAMELLRDTDWPVGRIAKVAGFNSPGRFATAFRKKVGITPLAYRKQNRHR